MKKKKNSAHPYFLSFLAGKSATIEQMLLTEWINKNGACVITDPVFKFFGGKIENV